MSTAAPDLEKPIVVYDRRFAKFSRPAIHPAVSRVLSPMPRGRLLDLPAGSGALSYRLYKEGFDVTACDLNPGNFEPKEIPVVRGDFAQRLPFNDATFDYATFVEGPEHAENPYQAFREFSRVLKPNGKLVVTIPHYTNIEARLRYLMFGTVEKATSQEYFRNELRGIASMTHITPLTYTQLRFFLEASGLTIEAIHRDKWKWRQLFLAPFTLALQGLTALMGRAAQKNYWVREANSQQLLQGGNTLIILARKAA